MFELQRCYGAPNNLNLLESKRKFLFEDKMSVLADNSDRASLVYFLSDLIIVCEPDPK